MNKQLYDGNALRHRLMNDEALVVLVAKEFLADMPRQLTSLQAALVADDAAASGRHAHSIKGAAANMGTMALSCAAAQMERACAEGRLAEAAAELPALQNLWRATRAAIETALPVTVERKSA